MDRFLFPAELADQARILALKTKSEKSNSLSLTFFKTLELSNLTQAEQQSIGLEPDNDLGITLRNGLRDIWVQSVADKNFDEIVTLYKKENGQGPEFTWDHVQLDVTEWQGVEVNDNIASAQFVSRYVFNREGHSAPGLETQWKVELARQSSSGGWFLISRKGTDLENH